MNNRLVQGLADPRKNLLFFLVFGTFGLTLASDALSDLVLNRFGEYLQTHWQINPVIFRLIIFVVIMGLIILAIALSNLSRWITINRPSQVQPKPLKATFPGLIVIASPGKGISSARGAIEHHWSGGIGNLKYCWIICGGKESLKNAREMVKGLSGKGQWIDNNEMEYILSDHQNSDRQLCLFLRNLEPPNNDDPNETFKLVNSIYEKAESEGIASEEIIADYTGGTKSMTAGMVLACADPDRLLAFMRPEAYTSDGYADLTKPSIATEVKVNFQVKAAKPPR